MLNYIIFGMRYEENDPVWRRIQKLRSDGVKELSIAGGLVNFLPWVRLFDRKLVKTVNWIRDGIRETHQEYNRVTKLREKDDDEESTDKPMNLTNDYLNNKFSIS